jgi:hypothetical protein
MISQSRASKLACFAGFFGRPARRLRGRLPPAR